MREAKTSEKLRRSEQHGKLRRLVQRSPNLLFKWRRNALCAQVNSEPAVLLPVQLKPELLSSQVIAAVPHPPAEDQSSRSTSSIELEVAGALVRLQGDVNEANLRSVLRALRQRP